MGRGSRDGGFHGPQRVPLAGEYTEKTSEHWPDAVQSGTQLLRGDGRVCHEG